MHIIKQQSRAAGLRIFVEDGGSTGTLHGITQSELQGLKRRPTSDQSDDAFVVLYCNFRSLPFLGGFLIKAAKNLIYSYPPECS